MTSARSWHSEGVRNEVVLPVQSCKSDRRKEVRMKPLRLWAGGPASELAEGHDVVYVDRNCEHVAKVVKVDRTIRPFGHEIHIIGKDRFVVTERHRVLIVDRDVFG